MGTDVFDPDNETQADFCRDVLGWQTATPDVARSGSCRWQNRAGLLSIGAFFGLAFGFSPRDIWLPNRSFQDIWR